MIMHDKLGAKVSVNRISRNLFAHPSNFRPISSNVQAKRAGPGWKIFASPTSKSICREATLK
jgi:hypothetical protein